MINQPNWKTKNYLEVWKKDKNAIIFYPKCNSNKTREILVRSDYEKVKDYIDATQRFNAVDSIHIVCRNHLNRILSTYFDKVCENFTNDPVHRLIKLWTSHGLSHFEGFVETTTGCEDQIISNNPMFCGKDSHIESYSRLHSKCGIMSIDELKEKYNVKVHRVENYQSFLDDINVPKDISDEILATRTPHSLTYCNKPYKNRAFLSLNEPAFFKGKNKPTAKSMYNHEMVDMIKEYYKDDANFDETLCEIL